MPQDDRKIKGRPVSGLSQPIRLILGSSNVNLAGPRGGTLKLLVEKNVNLYFITYHEDFQAIFVTVQLVPILTAEGAEIAEIQIAFRLVCLA